MSRNKHIQLSLDDLRSLLSPSPSPISSPLPSPLHSPLHSPVSSPVSQIIYPPPFTSYPSPSPIPSSPSPSPSPSVSPELMNRLNEMDKEVKETRRVVGKISQLPPLLRTFFENTTKSVNKQMTDMMKQIQQEKTNKQVELFQKLTTSYNEQLDSMKQELLQYKQMLDEKQTRKEQELKKQVDEWIENMMKKTTEELERAKIQIQLQTKVSSSSSDDDQINETTEDMFNLWKSQYS